MPQVVATRPRIFLTPASLADLKSRAVPANPRWQVLKDLVDRPGDPSWDIGIMDYALAYLVTGNGHYAEQAWNLMTQSMQSGTAQASNPPHLPTMGPPAAGPPAPTGSLEVSPDSGYQARSYFPAACTLLDWCWPALTPAQRQQLIIDIEACADWIFPRTNPSRAGAWAIDSVGNNYHAGFQYTWIAGLALMGESNKAQGYLDEALRRWNSMILPYLNTTAAGGALFEGTSYSVDWLGMTLLQLFAHSTATDQDLLTPQFATGWCGDAIRWLTHMTAPTRDRLAPIGDQTKSSGGALQDSTRLPMLVAAHQGDTPARLWLDATTPNRVVQRSSAWYEFMFYPGTPALPTEIDRKNSPGRRTNKGSAA